LKDFLFENRKKSTKLDCQNKIMLSSYKKFVRIGSSSIGYWEVMSKKISRYNDKIKPPKSGTFSL